MVKIRTQRERRRQKKSLPVETTPGNQRRTSGGAFSGSLNARKEGKKSQDRGKGQS